MRDLLKLRVDPGIERPDVRLHPAAAARDACIRHDGDIRRCQLRYTRGAGRFVLLRVQADRHLRAVAKTIERHPRDGDQEILVEGHFAVDDAARDGERQLHHLPLRLVNHLDAQGGELVQRLRQAAEDRLRALRGRFRSRAFALLVTFRKRLALECRQPGVMIGRVAGDSGRLARRGRKRHRRLAGRAAPRESRDRRGRDDAARSRRHRPRRRRRRSRSRLPLPACVRRRRFPAAPSRHRGVESPPGPPFLPSASPPHASTCC